MKVKDVQERFSSIICNLKTAFSCGLILVCKTNKKYINDNKVCSWMNYSGEPNNTHLITETFEELNNLVFAIQIIGPVPIIWIADKSVRSSVYYLNIGQKVSVIQRVVWIIDHAKIGHLSTIWIPDEFGIHNMTLCQFYKKHTIWGQSDVSNDVP